MVGSAVGIDDSSRAERKRHIHIEAKMSQNLRSFLGGVGVTEAPVVSTIPESCLESRSLGVAERTTMVYPGHHPTTRHALLLYKQRHLVFAIPNKISRSGSIHQVLRWRIPWDAIGVNPRGTEDQKHIDDQCYWRAVESSFLPRSPYRSHKSSQVFTMTARIKEFEAYHFWEHKYLIMFPARVLISWKMP